MKNTAKILRLIKASRSIAITTHVNPDGDALGSEVALGMFLGQLRKRHLIINSEAHIPRYDFLHNVSKIISPKNKSLVKQFPDLLIVVDCPELKRIGPINDIVIPKKIINIDHHKSNCMFGDLNYVDADASSTAELVYGVIKGAGVKLSRGMAEALFCAIVTDTGFFSQENTRPETLEMAAELMRSGVRPEYINWEVCGKKSLGYLELEALIRSTLKLHKKGGVCTQEVRNHWIKKYHAKNTDTNDFFTPARMLDGVKIAVLFWERKTDEIKVSFRSKDPYDACKLAQKFGGGGHRLAAGCTIKATLNQAKAKVLREIKI